MPEIRWCVVGGSRNVLEKCCDAWKLPHGPKMMMPGGPRKTQHGREVLSGARKMAGVHLNVADFPMCSVVDLPGINGGRCCLPGHSCVPREHRGGGVESHGRALACWQLRLRHRVSADVLW